MSIVKIAKEASELLSIWNSLTGCSIAFEIENTDLGIICEMKECKQGAGTRKGTWDNIPTGSSEECGTQHDGVFGAGNLGGVVYKVKGGLYFGLIWADPSIGSAQYSYAYGDENYVKKFVEEWWGKWFKCIEISTSPSKTLNLGNVSIQIQPGFDPFKVRFYLSNKSEINSSSISNFSTDVEEIEEPTPLGKIIANR